MKRVLILHTSVGLGHKVVAENIGYHLKKSGFEVVLKDILEVESGWLVSLGTYVHRFVNLRMPWFWKWVYCSKGFARITMPFRTKLASSNSKKTKLIIDEVKPDLVICTQTTASAAVASLKQRGLYKGLFGIAFSDYHFHPYWYYDEADFYLTNIEEQVVELEKFGVSKDKMVVLGMLMKDKVLVSVDEVRSRAGFEDGEKMVLVVSGSLGTGFPVGLLDRVVDLAQNEHKNWKFVIVSGKSNEAREYFEKRYTGKPVVVYGYYSPMENLLASADLLITKPGGLSIAEAVYYKVPILISHWLPGQEELNYDYLKRNKLVLNTEGSPYEKEGLQDIVDIFQRVLMGQKENYLTLNSNLIVDSEGPSKLVSFVKRMFHE